MKYVILICTFISVSLSQNFNSEVSSPTKLIPINCSYVECQDYLFYGNNVKKCILLMNLEIDSFVNINVYSKETGIHIKNLNSKILLKGKNEILWNGKDKNGNSIIEPV